MEIEVLIILFSLLLGSCVGSFINVVIFRLPRDISVIVPRSKCLRCNKQIKWFDNIPLLSWILLRGKCRYCSQRISFQYPLIEIITALFFLLSNYANPLPLENNSQQVIVVAGWIFASILLSLSVIDINTFLLPEKLLRVGFITGICIILLGSLGLQFINSLIFLLSHLAAMIIGFVCFEVLRILGSAIFRKPAMGQGDSKLVSLIGLWLGIKGLGISVYIAFIISGTLAIIALLLKIIKSGQKIPFGPFLSLGGLIVWYFGNDTLIDLFFKNRIY